MSKNTIKEISLKAFVRDANKSLSMIKKAFQQPTKGEKRRK